MTRGSWIISYRITTWSGVCRMRYALLYPAGNMPPGTPRVMQRSHGVWYV